ncbi:D-glycero-alpha-D-manno-heptose-1,7-bisphosphate 7-phosphatase [Demequina sp. SO4-13]|uniref:D-glycero-alpha-D-manno-heptose-1,7-bisphosphate 7-phosphatase n=1 Tax=Demequina sp. SO4-13 TaxID=3401027 RepID=UPI003AF72D3A
MTPYVRFVRGILFDRDDTLVVDVPWNGDPDAVDPMPTAAQAVSLARSRGLKVGVATNQSGIGRGLLTPAQVDAVNARVEALLGPFDGWFVCPHAPGDGCDCRKPAPGLILSAARSWRMDANDIAMIGDIGADVEAAGAAGAAGVLVPTPSTRAQEVDAARTVATSVLAAVQQLIDGIDDTQETEKGNPCALR